ncbi:hypothetical protein GYA93_17825 [Gordonia desulfuricans]|uniref:Uncharacterized protein n=1 Tax=Gordonia desulfuricans TaxID=89051 RepID=A0A7K3LT65_9ACTN|nr:hypothetical protein [Gordonia desulfuricans]NDK91422.1 hypothetical protein [Gordonia desulfuricans]
MSNLSNLEYLVQRGHERATAEKVALGYDYSRRPAATHAVEYREGVPIFTMTPRPTDREWLLSCGYREEAVDAYLEERAAEARRRAEELAARKAYERTCRYRLRQAWKEARYRVDTAWTVLTTGRVEDDEW